MCDRAMVQAFSQPDHVGLVVGEVTLGQGFLRVL
jgi:hypothetical protein